MSKKKNDNTFTKILIVLVIASLALLAMVYVLQITRNNNNDGLTNPIVNKKSIKKFDAMKKMIVSGDMEITDRCGLFGCELKVFTEGNWQLAKKTDAKYLNNEKGIEINIHDYESCSNEEYIIPPYSDGYHVDNETFYITYPYLSNVYPCESSAYPDFTFVKIHKKNSNDIDDYMNDFILIEDDNDPDSSIKIKYNDEYIISYQSWGMLEFDCFLILGNEYQYNICKLSNNGPREIDTSILEDIKILK